MKKHIKLIPTLAILTCSSSLFAASSGGMQYLKGAFEMDYLKQYNYNPVSNDDKPKHLLIRAELGAKFELDSKLEFNINFAYDGEAGDKTHEGTDGANPAKIVLDDAYVKLKKVLRPDLDIIIGRQPVRYNLRRNNGAFLYDSYSNDSDVTSWDGIQILYNWDEFEIKPFYFMMNSNVEIMGELANAGDSSDNESVYGIFIEWNPENEGNNEIYFCGSYSVENEVPLYDGTNGSELTTWYVGAEWQFEKGIDVFAEYALQSGSVDSTTDFGGYAYSAGATWRTGMMAPDDTAITIKVDVLSGDTSKAGSSYDAFVAPHEGISDTYIVENEKYGELSEIQGLLDGNLEDLKLMIEHNLTPDGRRKIKSAFAKYRIENTNADDDFGFEADASFEWDYNEYAKMKLFAASFFPGSGYKDMVAGAEDMYLFGANIFLYF